MSPRPSKTLGVPPDQLVRLGGDVQVAQFSTVTFLIADRSESFETMMQLGRGPGDGSDLDVDLLHGTASSLQFGKDAPKFFGGVIRVGPNDEGCQRLPERRQVALTARTAFDATPMFSQDRDTDPNPMSGLTLRDRPLPNATALGLVVLSDAVSNR